MSGRRRKRCTAITLPEDTVLRPIKETILAKIDVRKLSDVVETNGLTLRSKGDHIRR